MGWWCCDGEMGEETEVVVTETERAELSLEGARDDAAQCGCLPGTQPIS